MPYVFPNNKPAKSLKEAILYAYKCFTDGLIYRNSIVNSSALEMYDTIVCNQNFWRYKGEQRYISVVISYADQDFDKFGWTGLTEHAEKVVNEKYPNHHYVVGPHTDTNTPHVHIVIDKVNFETGKVIQNKFNAKSLRAISDVKAKEMGISALKVKDVNPELPKEASSVEKTRHKVGKWGHIKDMKQKADFALAIATDYSEYAELLGQFGIKIRVEEKNISYFHPSRKRPTRGKNLGDQYDKKGLTEVFLSNKDRFKDNPAVKEILKTRNNAEFIDQWAGRNKKSLESFKSLGRRKLKHFIPSEDSLKRIEFPRSLINKAKETSILDYCKENKIQTKKLDNGKIVLKGREHVELTDFSWKNNKNHVQGNIIDFVSNHKSIDYIDSIAFLTDNERVKLFKSHFDFKKNEYKPFHIPKEKRMKDKSALKTAQSLLYSLNIKNEKGLKHFFYKNQIQVTKDGIIRLFGDEENKGVFEFVRNDSGNWKKSWKGGESTSFFKSKNNSKKLTVFKSPFDFLKASNGNSPENLSDKENTLVLMKFDFAKLDNFLAENPHINEINLFVPKDEMNKKKTITSLFKIQQRYKDFNVSVNLTNTLDKSESKSLSIEL